ncbi:hypothetical protein [Flavobacterium sp. N2270]|uniref:hypothetical protein n=1 Tax=Flavobacterium sp. N2270 TaxID=2986831 RepID=UPI00222521B3|nr:hypothetical protein [Flavobacterium sp. N2270]
MNFIKNNFISIFIGTILISIIIYAKNKNSERNLYLNNNILFTVCETIGYDSPGRVTPSIEYIFYFEKSKFESEDFYDLDFSKVKKEDLKSYVGKKYFVKFSVEKPQYSEIYLDKPVPLDFVYKEGQTWKKIPVNYN